MRYPTIGWKEGNVQHQEKNTLLERVFSSDVTKTAIP